MIGQEQLRVNTKEQIPTVPYFDGVNGDQSFSSDDSFKNLRSSKIIPFRHKEIDSITLNEWLQSYRTNNQLQNLFVNMDIAMKYIHDQGYYISSFALDRISLLNHSIRQIQFQELAPLPYDISQQKQVVRDNIFMASVLHIGLYAKCLQHFTMNTIPAIKDNFQQFTIFLPLEDVPYYSGIIEKGASVYYSAYVGERKKRDSQNLEKEVSSGENNSSGKRLVKTNGSAYTAEDFLPQNEEANKCIYASLVKKEAAFARALIYPILVFVLGFVILFLSYLFR